MADFKRLMVIWTRANNDRAVTTIDFSTGAPDQEGAVEALFDTLWANNKQNAHPNTALAEYRWYGHANGPPAVGGDWGPTFRSILRSVPGTAATAALPPQCAIVVTEVTPGFMRHQGRMYFPIGCAHNLTADGRITTDTVNQLVGSCVTFYNACYALGYIPYVVGSTAGIRAIYNPHQLRANNSWDIQRRRGYEQATHVQTTNITHL